MFCQNCRYNLRGLTAGRCPECGQEFDSADSDTFSRRASRFSIFVSRAVLARGMLALVVFGVWSLTAWAPRGSVASYFEGPFTLIHGWYWSPWFVIALMIGAIVLALTVLWISSGRILHAGLALFTAAASTLFSMIIQIALSHVRS